MESFHTKFDIEGLLDQHFYLAEKTNFLIALFVLIFIGSSSQSFICVCVFFLGTWVQCGAIGETHIWKVY